MRPVYLCFLLSGFTGLLYQTVWMRMALAKFGVTTPVVSAVLTAFMLGLSAGSFLAGRLAGPVERRFNLAGLQLYASLELFISAGAFGVPALFDLARDILLSAGAADSAAYTAQSALLLSAALLPFSTAMGATFPAALSYLRRIDGRGTAFSCLYLANISGAVAGVLLPSLILIELFGFRTTLAVGAALNIGVAILALLSAEPAAGKSGGGGDAQAAGARARADSPSRARRLALFLTGMSSMGMEVSWTRMYTPLIGTFVYSFAVILSTYLIFTGIGSAVYRRRIRDAGFARPWSCWPWICIASMLPALTASAGDGMSGSVEMSVSGIVRILLGLGPFCALLGFLTPAFLDEESGGCPGKAGSAYGLNLLGCVLGPLLSGFVLIPTFGSSMTAMLLAAPLFLFLLVPPVSDASRPRTRAVAFASALVLWGFSAPFDSRFPEDRVRHDHTATVVASGEGMHKRLFVNGVSITHLTPVTKLMTHLPMAHLDTPAGVGRGLVICMGMGTSFRSLMSWGGPAAVVELVPSVPDFFSFFYPDAAPIPDSARIVIDDGRRFLDRTGGMFDMITVDPPPPVEAAGSSLLYSKEFYRSVLSRLNPRGIVQVWLPDGDLETIHAVTRSIAESFAHVRIFSYGPYTGFHFLASRRPLPRLTAAELVRRMPEAAVRDMTEWGTIPPEDYFGRILTRELDPARLMAETARGGGTALTDDRPVNEFFFVRRHLLRRR